MKLKYRIFIFYGILFVTWMIFGSNASNPPNAHTNAPFDQFCTQCHGGGQFDGTISITGIPAMVDAGQTYQATFTATVTQGSPSRAGFQLVSVFADGNANAGNLVANGNGVGTNSSNGRVYVEHRGARNISGGTVSWNFSWVAPNGPDGATITMYYACNLTNGNGSTSGDRPISGSTSFILNADSAPLVAGISNQINVSCNGDNDGSATADANGGTPPYSYQWSNGGSAATITSLSAGNYTVTISDANMMMASASVTITEPPALGSTMTTMQIECHGGASGSATANPSGGTSPYRYNWSNGASTRTINGLAAGSYQVTITDANDCTTTDMVQISEPPQLNLDVTGTDESAPMAGDGTATVVVSGGTAPYSVEWSTGATSTSIMNLSAGSYSVTVTDANDCEAIGMVAIQGVECNLQSTVSIVPPSCFGTLDGSAQVVVTGAQQPVSYDWSDGQTTSEAVNLGAGMYDVTISDAGGCQTIMAVMIGEPEQISVQFIPQQPSCPASSDGSVIANVSGGTAPYVLAWSDGSNSTTLSGVSAGIYPLVVTDANGCERTDSIVLTAQDSIQPLLVSQPGTVFLDSTGSGQIPLELPFVGGTDACGIDSIWSVPSNVDCSLPGELEVTYHAMDGSGNESQVTSTVTLRDTIKPVFLTCVDDIEADSGTTITYVLPEATDNCGVDSFALTEGLPSGSVFPPGETKVSYMATDASGNYACCSFFVRIGNTVPTVDHEFSQKISISPNPVDQQINIHFSGLRGQPERIVIFSSWGQEILQVRGSRMDGPVILDATSLAPGMYYAQILMGGKIGVRKFLKN